MNVTLSIDDRLLHRAREVARQRGQSLNSLVRSYLETLAGERDGDEIVRELLELMDKCPGHSKGRRFKRGDAYEGRL
ncbi:MAG: hypothetical protein HY814_10785 [Candidatus Riflebacteria bacterium]|nr:hypothetical protein [Candidatus Riflebacteria bacterium]